MHVICAFFYYYLSLFYVATVQATETVMEYFRIADGSPCLSASSSDVLETLLTPSSL
jgi:hypothetical protein